MSEDQELSQYERYHRPCRSTRTWQCERRALKIKHFKCHNLNGKKIVGDLIRKKLEFLRTALNRKFLKDLQ